MLDIKRLQILREVALQGSFSAAASELQFSPSAVSQQIAQLEREVGATLVDRLSTGVVLTPAGRVLLGHANAILARAAEAEEELRQLADGHAGTLRVAAFTTAAAALMPDAIVEFRRVHPAVDVELVEQDRETSVSELHSGKLDLAVIARGSFTPRCDDDFIERIPLLEERIDVLLPERHRLADAPAVSLQDLAGERWADCGGRAAAYAMAAAGIDATIVFTSDNHGVLQGIVAAGMAVCFVPQLAQLNLRPDVVVKRLEPRPPIRHVSIAVRHANRRPAALGTMIEAVQASAARFRQGGDPETGNGHLAAALARGLKHS
jgi:DNA-binding transcriptional LysR family regulator